MSKKRIIIFGQNVSLLQVLFDIKEMQITYYVVIFTVIYRVFMCHVLTKFTACLKYPEFIYAIIMRFRFLVLIQKILSCW